MDRKRQKLTPGKNDVQKECQEAEITALKKNLVDMEAKLKRVIVELEQVKEERARDKIDFETEKRKLESKINKYKEQCTELQSENEKLQTEKKRRHEKDNYLQDLGSANINVEEKSQTNLCNTNLNSQITKNDVQKACQEAEIAALKRKLVDMEAKLKRVNKTNDDVLHINALPNEIILKIFTYLRQNQLGEIARVCRRWDELTKSPCLWSKVDVKIFCSSDRERNAVVKSFIDGLPSCVTFIKLRFSVRENLDFEELCVKLQQNCSHLEELILMGLKMSNLFPEDINICTQFLQDVKKLVFHYCLFPEYPFMNMNTAELNDNSEIEVLDLFCCHISHFSKIEFSKLLYLKELRLNRTDVDDTWFVDNSFLNQLHILDLGWTSITASTFLAIQRHAHNLKELYLCTFNLDDDLNFNESVFPHLRTICLSCTGVTCDGIVSLIQSCPSLENVYVDEDAAVFFAAHPFVVANRCKAGIVKAIDWNHNHKVDYSHN